MLYSHCYLNLLFGLILDTHSHFDLNPIFALLLNLIRTLIKKPSLFALHRFPYSPPSPSNGRMASISLLSFSECHRSFVIDLCTPAEEFCRYFSGLAQKRTVRYSKLARVSYFSDRMAFLVARFPFYLVSESHLLSRNKERRGIHLKC